MEEHFVCTSSDPDVSWEVIKDIGWERGGEPVGYVIADLLCVDEPIAEAIRSHLADRFYDHEEAEMCMESRYDESAQYEEADVDDSEFWNDWRDLVQSLKTHSRFFNSKAKQVFNEIFDGLDELSPTDSHSVFKQAGVGKEITHLFRARILSRSQIEEALKFPVQNLGPPPSKLARAGRMNPHGISVFYGATDCETAVAEVRPPVGSDVLVGRFEIIRPIQLLDLEAMQKAYKRGTCFNPTDVHAFKRAKFLRALGAIISRAVLPGDEPFEYLPTQAMAEYLSNREDLELDGILFGSAQTSSNGQNVVLFHEASRVETQEIAADTETTVRHYEVYDDGYESDFTVWVEPRVEEHEGGEERVYSDECHISTSRDTLRLNLEAMSIHHVERIECKTQERRVWRHVQSEQDKDHF
jgi:hypothetical protein